MTFNFQITFNDGPTGAGDSPQLSGRISRMVVTNNSGESISYSSNSGSSFATLTAGSSVTLGSGDPTSFRFRRVNSGSYPLAVDAVVTMSVPMSEGYFDTNPTTGGAEFVLPGRPNIGVAETYTAAQLSGLTPTTGMQVIVSDLNSAVLTWNGSRWTSPNPILLANAAVPVVIFSSGSIGTNGALTGVAARYTVDTPGCWAYFAAGQVYSGSVAGYYWCVMSSTTAGTLYDVRLGSSVPYVPINPTAIVAAGPGAFAYAGATEGPAINCGNIPGGILGTNGTIRFSANSGSNGNSTSILIKLGATAVHNTAMVSSANMGHNFSIRNRGAANRQFVTPVATVSDAGLYGVVPQLLNVDTTVAQMLSANIFVSSTASQWVGFEGFSTELLIG